MTTEARRCRAATGCGTALVPALADPGDGSIAATVASTAAPQMAEAAPRRAIRPITEDVDIDPKMIPQAETRHQKPGAGKGITPRWDGPSDIADARSHEGIRPPEPRADLLMPG